MALCIEARRVKAPGGGILRVGLVSVSDHLGSLRGSFVKIATIHRKLTWPRCKDDTHKSRSVNKFLFTFASCHGWPLWL